MLVDETVIRHFRQSANPWDGDTLGHGTGPRDTLGWEGCEAVAFGVGANALNGTAYTPREYNEALKLVPGAFVRITKDDKGRTIAVPGPLIVLETAAAHFGLRAPDAERIRSKPGDPALGKLLCETLDQPNRLAIVHVDLSGDGWGDHFVLAYGRESGMIKLSDPAPGALRFIDDVNLEGVSDWAGTLKHYRVVGVAPFYKV